MVGGPCQGDRRCKCKDEEIEIRTETIPSQRWLTNPRAGKPIISQVAEHSEVAGVLLNFYRIQREADIKKEAKEGRRQG